MAKKNILFTGGGGAGSEAIWHIWKNTYSLFFADASIQSISPLIPEENCIAIPFAHDSTFITRVHDICRELSIDVLIPGVDEELAALATFQGHKDWPIILSPSQHFVSLMLDKLACFEALTNAGLKIPQTALLTKAEGMQFPLIAKPRSGRGSRGVKILKQIDQVRAYLTLQSGDADRFIAQELLTGQEYTVFVCADQHGQLCTVIPVKVVTKRGITILAQTEYVPEITDYIIQLQAKFKPTGIYNVQCMLSDNRVVIPFEINPRISTTFCLAISTGFDPVSIFLDPGGVRDTPYFIPKVEYLLQRNWANHITSIS